MAIQRRKPGLNITGAFSLGLSEAPDLSEEFSPNDTYHVPAYIVSLKDLSNLKSKDLEDVAREVAWQCLAENPTQDRAVIGEVTPVNNAPSEADHAFDGPVRMTSLSHGDVIDRAYQRVKDLHANPDRFIHDHGNHEPRILRIPGLLITAVWLKSQTNGGKDWIFPVHTKLPGLEESKTCSMEQFLKVAQTAAGKRLTSNVFD